MDSNRKQPLLGTNPFIKETLLKKANTIEVKDSSQDNQLVLDSSDNSSNFGIDLDDNDLIFKDQPKKVEGSSKPQLLSCENKDSSIVEINE